MSALLVYEVLCTRMQSRTFRCVVVVKCSRDLDVPQVGRLEPRSGPESLGSTRQGGMLTGGIADSHDNTLLQRSIHFRFRPWLLLDDVFYMLIAPTPPA